MADDKEPKPKAKSDPEQDARDAELARQDALRDAVAKAHDDELPKLGGPILDPGLGQ